ncbi:MAG: TRAP-type mannitol/chloroaromatic compound transport system substrate-binding protein [Gammaproteobacteria bacterium]|jgi:TRAP-type mannitol/chloroaromatic compound transport system substrate-binding protein
MFEFVARRSPVYAWLVVCTLLLNACGGETKAPSGAVSADQKFKWKMVTAWPPNLPVNHDVITEFAAAVDAMSRGQLTIQVYAGGELIPALEVFDAVSNGTTVQMGHGAAYYWAGKVPAAQFMSAVPFGLTASGMSAWMYGGDGLKLWRDVYAPFDIVPFPMGNTGTQMGGWFNKRIDSPDDLQGLKMRIPGLGGKTLAEAGGNPILLSGGEVYTALERGNIDATEWVGPLHDVRFGLDRAAKYYYYPGWHEPSTQLELIVNKTAWESLPQHLQTIIDTAATAAGVALHARMEVENAKAYAKLRESGHVELVQFPQDVLATLHASAKRALDAEAGKDEDFRAVRENFETFRDLLESWDQVSEGAYRQYFERVKEERK